MPNVKVTRDATDTYAIVRHGTLDPTLGFVPNDPTVGARFLGELQAVGNLDGTISINNEKANTDELSSVPFADFIDSSDSQMGADEASTVNALNAVFDPSGASGVPTVTSSLSVNATQGDSFNYELTGLGIAGIEWTSIPSGLAVSTNNRRNVLGTAPTVGSYTIAGNAVNAFGSTLFSVSLTVSAPPYSNTKSVNFSNNDYMGANAALLDSILGRASNGSGASDAWSISLWFKPGTATNQNQTLVYFGAQDVANNGQVQVKWNGSTTSGGLSVRYGSNNNRIEVRTAVGSNPLTVGQWSHILVTYDGGTTGAASGSLSDYYSRFRMFVDGVEETLTGSHSNFGFTGQISGQNFRIGRWNTGQTLRNNSRVDEVAIWEGDESSNASAIYNSGSTHDLSLLASAPDHWWRMGDGDTYPTIQDNIGSAHFVMYNMSASDIVNDAP